MENNLGEQKWTWEVAYKKWFFIRFTLLLIAFGLALALAYIQFVKVPQYNRLASDIADYSYNVPAKANVAASTNEWKTFKNETYGVEFSYPASFVLRNVDASKPVETVELGKMNELFEVNNYNEAKKEYTLAFSVSYAPLDLATAEQKIRAYHKDYGTQDIVDFKKVLIGNNTTGYVHQDTTIHAGIECDADTTLVPTKTGLIQIQYGKCQDLHESGTNVPLYTRSELDVINKITSSFKFTK